MKKNLLLFVANLLLLFSALLIIHGVSKIQWVLGAVIRAETFLLVAIIIVASIMLIIKRWLEVPNKKYFKNILVAQLVIYIIFFGSTIWISMTSKGIGGGHYTYYVDSSVVSMSKLKGMEELNKEIAWMGKIPHFDTANFRRSHVVAELAHDYLIKTLSTQMVSKYVDTMIKIKQISVMPINQKINGVRYQDSVVFTFQVLENANIFYASYLCNDNNCILLNLSNEVNKNYGK